MRKKAILIVGLALMIAAAGVVYAHWTETLTVDATVNTGSIYVRWINVFTDDDGGNSSGEETGLGAPLYVYSADGTSSVDPASAGYPNFATRYDKDVADCYASLPVTTDGHVFNLVVNNAYPSYHCTSWSTFQNQGTVPVKLQSMSTTVTKNGVAWFPGGNDATWQTLDGTLCGLQIDPVETNTTINTIHILNAADGENDAFVMHQELVWVNWNEWSAANCTASFNGIAQAFPLEP